MEYPIRPALAQAVPVVPHGPDWWYEPKFDGHRTILRRTKDTVILYARSGRVVTSHWMDLAVAAMQLPAGTTLDGEAVVWRNGRIDFAAAQSRAASSITRARALAAQHPASYAAWDVLEHPDYGQTTGLPYTDRRQLLLDLLHDIPPPIQAVPATDDRAVAVAWYEGLQEQGIEGIVCKKGTAGYPAGRRGWTKVRHADTEDALVVGYLGPRRRPHRLALAVGDEGGPIRLSARLNPVLAGRIGDALTAADVVGERRAEGETYTRVDSDLTVEVLAGSGRHGTLTVNRMR
ncbi:putative ATP-dependent DNA ligase YkoU [Streptomyces sp. ADI96-02]|uniref:ATP-dependent DNA ligase n=1 Tax=Streptomyces sp. ADI96-02 TaxID=1522760 RepID=UPI000F5540FB|nr:DNA ligase [Streptomyces sp. ADI96-02]RPK56265.1 putative ATP-dependent DNA ligase YkoU [Streptomyces sp. ADI96-02]